MKPGLTHEKPLDRRMGERARLATGGVAWERQEGDPNGQMEGGNS